MKIEFDWSECELEVREAIDEKFAADELCRESDNASCGWFTIDLENRNEHPALVIRKFADILYESANNLNPNE